MSMHAILILGAAVWADGPSPTLRRRTAHGAALWHKSTDTIIIPCGGIGRHGKAEALVMKELLVEMGVPMAKIIPEVISTTTLENIQFALPLCEHAESVTIVTDHYHCFRARMVARHFGVNAIISYPRIRNMHLKTQIRQYTREAFALPAYAVKLHRMRNKSTLTAR